MTMDKTAFLEELADILDVDVVEEAANLRDYASWDSLAVLSVVSIADSKFGFTLSVQDIKKLTTVADLWAFFEKNRVK